MVRPGTGHDWLALSDQSLPVDAVSRWAARPDCGAVVVFSGTVRDHAEGRTGVTALEYEAYTEQVEGRLAELAAEARRRWPDVGRVALLHRVGRLAVGETSVVVAVSAPHRDAAFDAARWCIDTLKATVPIWKKEHWDGGAGWGTAATPVEQVEQGGAAVTNLLYVVVAVGVSVVGSLLLWFRRRKPTSMEAGIDEFNKELRALAPERRVTWRDRRPG